MADQHQRLGPVAWCLLSALLFGATTPASKALVDELGPILLSGLLYWGAALGVAVPALRSRRAAGLRTIRIEDRLRLLGAIVFGGIVGPILLLWGLSLATAGSVSLWLTLETVATAILARIFFREHLGLMGGLATVLVVAASVVIADPAQGGLFATGLVALACLAWGLDNNLTSVIEGLTTAQITFWKGLIAGAVTVPIGLVAGAAGEPIAVATALSIGAIGYGLSLGLYVAGAQQLGATRSQLLFSSSPLFGLGVAATIYAEPVGYEHGIAIALMASAIFLLARDSHEHEHSHHAIVHTHWHRGDDGHHTHVHEGISSKHWHQHEHRHEPQSHAHVHWPDLHHRHLHEESDKQV